MNMRNLAIGFLSGLLMAGPVVSNQLPPPRGIGDLAGILKLPTIEPTENLAPGCNENENDSGWVEKFEHYLTVYHPGDQIDTKLHPVGNRDIKYGFQLYKSIAGAELRRGNLEKAEQSQIKYISLTPPDQKGESIFAYAQLARIQIARGDLVNAENSLQQAQTWHDRKARNEPGEGSLHAAWIAGIKGDLAQASGNLAAAEAFYREALKRHTEYQPDSAEIAISHSKLAKVIAAQGRLLEAENQSRLAIGQLVTIKHTKQISAAQIFIRYARILIDQGRFREAEMTARSAVGLYQNKCSPADSVEFADARRTLAEVLSLQGRYDDALSIYRAIEVALGNNNQLFDQHFGNDLTLAYALIHNGDYLQAYQRLQKTVQKLDQAYGADHPLSAEARGFLAITEWKVGDKKTARKYFKEVLAILQDPKQVRGARPHNLRIIMETYLDMLAKKTALDNETLNTLFLISESLRNSSVQQSINAMGARAATSSPKLASLLRKEQDLSLTISALEATLSVALAENFDASEIQKEIRQRRKTHSNIMQDILDDFPEYGDLIKPAPVDIDGVRKILRNNEAFIASYSTDKKTYIWTITKEQPASLTRADLTAGQLQQQVVLLRQAFTPISGSLNRMPVFDVKLAHQLFNKILAPSKSQWETSDTLIFSLQGALGYLPMAVLPVKNTQLSTEETPLFANYREIPFLIKSHAIINLPSASSLSALRAIPGRKKRPQKLLGFGDPWFSLEQAEEAEQLAINRSLQTRGIHLRAAPALSDKINADIGLLPRLPETADELHSIAKMLGADYQSSLFLGKDANEDKVKSIDLEDFDIIAFATHGLIPGDLDGLTQPALALSAPEVSQVKGDGLLTMDEIMNLQLDTDWVVLSACNTGSSDGDDKASEAVSGLGRAFFYAGARSLLVSNWPVETNSARDLTTGIFRTGKHQANRAKALQSSMSEMIQSGEFKSGNNLHYSYAHPLFWAPFTLVGDYLDQSKVVNTTSAGAPEAGGFFEQY